jgi:hypothetical protein
MRFLLDVISSIYRVQGHLQATVAVSLRRTAEPHMGFVVNFVLHLFLIVRHLTFLCA